MKKQVVVITGAGSGLGKSAAIALAKRGHKIYATTHYEIESQKLNKLAKAQNLLIESFKLNILIEDDRKLLNNIDFDVLINNAAIGDTGSVIETKIYRFKNTFETNVFANIQITQIALKKFIQKKSGKVIFISSLLGRIPMAFMAPYSATKFAIESFASALKMEVKKLADCNIQIGIIEPGAYMTGFNKKMNEKKYNWMEEKSYFKYILDELRKNEQLKFNLLEKKNFNTIISKYVKAVETNKLKLRYSAPKFQSFFVQLARVFGK
ncbi:MAG: SDR family NAD(P)-dependent oxidoreductase [Clostridia bacterium]